MKRIAAAALPVLALTATLAAQGGTAPRPAADGARAQAKSLDIYIVDTEGGKAALFVTPAGQSVLIDSGNPGGRDTGRLMDAVQAAGLTRIDFLITTHYHIDHVGGMQALVERIPVGTFVDHGATVEERQQVADFQASYKALYDKAKHLVVKPGDKLPIEGLDWRIVTAGGQVLKTPLPGAGRPNPACASFTPKEITNDLENAESVGSVVTLGAFRAADFGDLLWNKEHELMCPNNPIGTIDLFLVSHHGLDQSNSPVLVHGLRPRVAIMQNGTRKGAGAQTMTTLRTSPGLEDIWQLHWAYGAGIEQNSAGVFIANVDDNATIADILTAPPRGGGPGRGAGPGAGPGGPPPQGAAAPAAGTAAPGAPSSPGAAPGGVTPATPAGVPGGQAGPAGPGAGRGGFGGRGGAAAAHTPAYWIKVSANADGSFTVTNSRNDFSKTYEARPRAR